MTREVFLYLFNHELKWRRDRQKPMGWSWIYIVLGVSAGLAFYTYSLLSDSFKLQYLWFYSYALPWVSMGMAFASISKEWKERRYSWWLSLPYSRMRLIQAKFLAAWLQTFKVYLVAITFMLFLSLYAVLISERFTFSMMLDHFANGLPWLLTLLAMYPIVAALSFLTFLSGHTKYRPIAPLLWVILIISLNGVYWFLSPGIQDDPTDIISNIIPVHLTSVAWLVILCSWLVAWGILRMVAKWLEREITI